jgi:hypothetical protein
MARDKALLNERNKRIRADYNRLKATEVILINRGVKVAIRPTYAQILTTLSESHSLTVRTLEPIIAATEPVLAPFTTPSPTQRPTA